MRRCASESGQWVFCYKCGGPIAGKYTNVIDALSGIPGLENQIENGQARIDALETNTDSLDQQEATKLLILLANYSFFSKEK